MYRLMVVVITLSVSIRRRILLIKLCCLTIGGARLVIKNNYKCEQCGCEMTGVTTFHAGMKRVCCACYDEMLIAARNNVLKKPKKEKKPSSKLSRDEKIRIVALNAAIVSWGEYVKEVDSYD